MKKSLLALITLSVFLPSLAFAQSFPDLSPQHQYSDAATFVKERGIVQGYPDGTFKPENTINRAEFIKIVVESKYQSEEIESCDLESITLFDVDKSAWFAPYVCIGLRDQIISGYEDNSFKGGNLINFAEASKIISNTFELSSDQSEGPWYANYVSALGEEMAIPADITSFEKQITRGEMIEMIYRLEAGIKTKASQTFNSISSGQTNVQAPQTNEESQDTEIISVSGLNLDDDCGHNLDETLISFGYNQVLDSDGNVQIPQGKPIQEGFTLALTGSEIQDHNSNEYARVFSIMAPIRDALMCDIETVSQEEWLEMTDVLTRNKIKTTQSLTGTPMEQYYSTNGIFDHLKETDDFHPMMKYLEEAELELKCLAFKDYDFTNPEGDNHCEIHGFEEGSGIK